MTTRKSVLEEALGQDITSVDWRKRMKEGVLVDLKIKRWRARKKLSLTELGIYPDSEAREAYEQLLTIGSKLLLPLEQHRELDVIERSARLHLKQWAYDTPFGYFVPFTSYNVWKTGNEEYKRRFFEKRDEIVASYPELLEQLLSEYEKIARHTYSMLLQQAPNLIATTFQTEEAFFTHFREEVILRNVKSALEFGDSFVYEEQLSRVPLLNNLDTEETTGQEVETEIRQKAQEEAADIERRMMLERMNRDIIQKAREQKESQIDAFFSAIVAQSRSVVYEAVTSVLTSIQEQDTLQGRPVIQLRHLIAQVGRLNFYEDTDIDQVIASLKTIVEQPAKERNLSEIIRQLRAIATMTRGTILALGEQPRTERDINLASIGIPEQPSQEDIREAREELYPTIHLETTEAPREEREEHQDADVPPLMLAEERENRLTT